MRCCCTAVPLLPLRAVWHWRVQLHDLLEKCGLLNHNALAHADVSQADAPLPFKPARSDAAINRVAPQAA